MFGKIFIPIAVVCILVGLIAGCEKKTTPPPPPPTSTVQQKAAAAADEVAAKAEKAAATAAETAETAVKTVEEHKTDADKQINKENAKTELDKLETEIKADAAVE